MMKLKLHSSAMLIFQRGKRRSSLTHESKIGLIKLRYKKLICRHSFPKRLPESMEIGKFLPS